MLSLCQRILLSRILDPTPPILITSAMSKVFEKIVAEKLSYFLKNNSPLPFSQFLYRRAWEYVMLLITLSHYL